MIRDAWQRRSANWVLKHDDSSGRSNGIRKWLWAVRPPGKSKDAIPVEATHSMIFRLERSRSHKVTYRDVFSVSPGVQEEDAISLIRAHGVENHIGSRALIIVKARFSSGSGCSKWLRIVIQIRGLPGQVLAKGGSLNWSREHSSGRVRAISDIDRSPDRVYWSHWSNEDRAYEWRLESAE